MNKEPTAKNNAPEPTLRKQKETNKLIALDLDGTILKEVHSLHREMEEMLYTLYSRGYEILINTGRTFAYSRHIFSSLNFPFFGGFTNGVALAAIVKKTLIHELSPSARKIFLGGNNTTVRNGFFIDVKYEKFLPPGLLPQIKKIFETRKIDPIFQSGITGGDTTTYEPLKYPTNELIEILSEDPERRIKVASISEYDSSQFVSVFGCTKDFTAAEEAVSECNSIEGLYSVAFLHSYYLNTMWITVGSRDINKGIPIRKLKEILNIKRENIYAFGNDRNDIPMLKEAGTAVAVEDSPEDVIAVANHVVKKPEEDGVLFFLKELL